MCAPGGLLVGNPIEFDAIGRVEHLVSLSSLSLRGLPDAYLVLPLRACRQERDFDNMLRLLGVSDAVLARNAEVAQSQGAHLSARGSH